MYDSYRHCVKDCLTCTDFNFKTNSIYNGILEHVSPELGESYIICITKFVNEHFPEITFKDINDYLLLNDKYGCPVKHNFIYTNTPIYCSPSSLRYVLQSLLILKHFKETGLNEIVEVGCGYGGLFLAINHFSKILNIKISNYYFIDLPEITGLIDKYVNLHKDILHIKFSKHLAYNYGLDINKTNLFFISNYCFTEIGNLHQRNYITYLFPKISHGFIIWQTICVPINNINMIGKAMTAIVEEYPQTANPIDKNYYVYF
jgi:hypothetical protein